ncbi:MAG: hypothetical protein Q8L28_00025 [bacterium]|nr:hypothetical protein [bacterium]
MKFEKGQSLFEVVVALAISTLVIIAVVSLAALSIRNTDFSKNKVLASKYAQEATEWLRGQRDADFEIFYADTLTNTWCLRALSFTQAGVCGSSSKIGDSAFYREVGFINGLTPNGETLVEARVRVYWNDAQGSHEVINSTAYTDWRQR